MDIPNANCEPFLGKTERDLLAGILLASGGTPASVPNTAACPEWGYGKHTVRDILGGILLAIQNGGGGGVDLSSPPPIGDVTPNTGEFTDLVAATFQGVIGNVTPAAGTFTRLTVNQGTLTDPVAGLALNATWNDAADTFRGVEIDVTDTASASASTLFRGVVGGTTVFQVRKTGQIIARGSISTDSSVSGLALAISSNTGLLSFGGNFDCYLTYGGSNALQVGISAETPGGVIITGRASNSGDNNGGDITLRGGNPSGSGLRGNVILFGRNRSPYIASPTAAEIRDILISHGLMAAS
jgi:hypothetical protein